MEPVELQAAISAAMASASALGLSVDSATVLHNSNRIAVRLLPCDALVRVAPAAHEARAAFEIAVARRLAETAAPAAGLDPRIDAPPYLRDGFVITFWTYYEPLPASTSSQNSDLSSVSAATSAEYAQALGELHAGMRNLELAAPRFTDRVAEALRLVDDRTQSPALGDADRELLSHTLRTLTERILARSAPEQLLHGEPHPGNLLKTKDGPLFIDLETCCRGPVEFDAAHAPVEVSDLYKGADQVLLGECRTLILAMVAAWRWDRDDEFPDGRQMGTELLNRLRAAINRTR